jgi:PAS domain-containing protein
MRQAADFFLNLFNTSDFPARWQSGNWTTFHGWMYIISDLMMAVAFISIPLLILRHILKNRCSNKVKSTYVVFGSFLVACGFALLSDAIIFWVPAYRLSALFRLFAGVFSISTLLILVRILPKVFSLKSQHEMEAEVKRRRKAERELQEKNNQLLEAEKIAKMCYGQWDMMNDNVILSDEGYQMYGLSIKVPFTLSGFIALSHPDDREYVKDKIDAIIKTKEFSEFYYRIIANNSEKHIRVNGQLQFNNDGRVSKIIGTLQDITEQSIYLEHIKEQNEKLKEIAWIQSHLVRGPLATIMGLASIIDNKHITDGDTAKALEGIKAASVDLDDIVKDIVSKSNSREMAGKNKTIFTRVA